MGATLVADDKLLALAAPAADEEELIEADIATEELDDAAAAPVEPADGPEGLAADPEPEGAGAPPATGAALAPPVRQAVLVPAWTVMGLVYCTAPVASRTWMVMLVPAAMLTFQVRLVS